MIFKVEARQDILDVVRWYERQRVGLGIKFHAALYKVFTRIEAMPELHRVIYQDARRASMRGFPFSVYYRLDQGEVVVLAVVHTSRDPVRWKSRL